MDHEDYKKHYLEHYNKFRYIHYIIIDVPGLPIPGNKGNVRKYLSEISLSNKEEYYNKDVLGKFKKYHIHRMDSTEKNIQFLLGISEASLFEDFINLNFHGYNAHEEFKKIENRTL